MSPIYSYLCHNCEYEFDQIDSYDSERATDCPRCEDSGSARRILAAPAPPRGSFGTTPRHGKDKAQEFNFNVEKKDE